MSAPRLMIGLLALGCLVGAGAAWRLESEIVNFRVKLGRDRNLERSLENSQKTAKELTAQLAELKTAVDKPSAATGKGEKPAAPAVDPVARRAAMVAGLKGWMAAKSAPMYAHLQRSLGLSVAQVDQLQTLSAERMADANMTFTNSIQAAGGGRPDAAALAAAATQAAAASEVKMQDLLGPAGYEQYQAQMRLAPAEAMVQQMTLNFTDSSSQLTDVQKDQLAELLTQNQPAQTGKDPIGTLFSSLMGANRDIQITDAAVDQAARVLSPDQLQVVRQYQAEAKAKQTVSTIARQQFEALNKAAQAQAAAP